MEGRVRGLSENYLGFRALEFRPLNPVSVGLRIRAQLECHFLVRNSFPVNLKSSVNCASPSLAPTFTPTNLFLLLLVSFFLPFRGTNNKPRLFNYFFKVDPGSRVNLLSNYFYTVQPGREIKCRENQIRNLLLKILKIVLCYCRVSIILCDLMITQEIDF